MVKEEACASIAKDYQYENMAKKANIQDLFEIIKKKIDTTGKEMLFTVMEFMNQKIDRTDCLAKMGHSLRKWTEYALKRRNCAPLSTE